MIVAIIAGKRIYGRGGVNVVAVFKLLLTSSVKLSPGAEISD